MGRGLVITAEVPAYDGDTYRGTFQVDLSIDRLVTQLDTLKLTPTGFAFYMDRDGEIIKGSTYDLVTGETERGNSALQTTLDTMRTGEQGVSRVTVDGNDMFIGFAPIPGVGGSLAMAASVEELTASAAAITAGIEDQGNRTFRTTLVAMGALFVAGLIGATYLNRQVLLKPIEALAHGTRSVAQGDLDVTIDLPGDDELGTLARSFNEMTSEVREARRELEQRVEERTRELTALLGISNKLASTLDLESLLRLIIEEVRSIADYSRCSIFMLEDDRFVLLDSKSAASSVPSGFSFSRADIEPIATNVLRQEPVIIDDVRTDSDEARAYQRGSGELFETEFRDIHSWMSVPLVVRDQVIGMLTLSHTQPNFYEQRQAGLVGAIATQIAIAIENARLYEQGQQLAAVEERQRLARELHDSVSQALYGIALGARTARVQLDRDPAAAVQPVDYVLSLAEAGLAEMRALIFELRPESLENEGLVAALEKHLAATRARYGIEVTADLGAEPPLNLDEKEVFFRLGQEALHNVVKHAQASRATVALSSNNGAVVLEVGDDGVGFDTSSSFPGHMGLVSMRERAAGIGAILEIGSTPGGGTTVRLSLPIRP